MTQSNMKARRAIRTFVVLVTILVLGVVVGSIIWPPLLHPLKLLITGRATVENRLAQYGPDARQRLEPYFAQAGLEYPPARFALVGIKSERRLELYAAGTGEPDSAPLRFIRSYPVLGASGQLGPKLREGDRQVPEGIYRIESLNPNSRYHLALRLDYPNQDDRARAEADGRTNLGGDIMIHGRTASIGCLAMGDPAIEEIFVLAADVGWEDALVVLAPVDLRDTALPAELTEFPWAESLYPAVERALRQFPGGDVADVSR